MLRKVGTESNLKQLLLRFYQQRRPQKQLGFFFVPNPISQLRRNIFIIIISFITCLFYYFLLTFICTQFLLTFLLATIFL